MANLRESYAATGYASLEWSELGEKAIDRVAASGKCAPLGVCLWKAKYLNESISYKKAQEELFVLCRNRYSDNVIVSMAVVDQALFEWIAPQCRVCNGEGERMFDDLKIVCEACSGSKMHLFKDEERATRMRLSYGLTKMLAHKIKWVMERIQIEDALVNARMNVELERMGFE